MKRAGSILGWVRSLGVSMRCERGNLVIEAPTGVITPEVRAEIAQSKAQLMKALRNEECESQQDIAAEAETLRQIAALLAVAYERYTRVKRVSTSAPVVNEELASARHESVHGHG